MTEIVIGARVRAEPRYFYFYIALFCLALAVVGFMPSYWLPIARTHLGLPVPRSFLSGPPFQADHKGVVFHLHGLIFSAWSAFFVYQSWLAAAGRIARHRLTGLIGVSLATAMLIFGVMVVIAMLQESAAAGMAELGRQTSYVALSSVAVFAALVATALAFVKHAEWHKRLMLMATISIMGAPVARWLIFFLHTTPLLSPGEGGASPEDCAIFVMGAIPLLHDWRARGRPHLANLIGLTLITSVRLARLPVIQTAAWHTFMGWLVAM